MADLSSSRVVANLTAVLAAQYNKLLGSILIGEFSNALSMSGTLTLTDDDYAIQRLNCNGANRIVKLPAAGVANHPFLIVNSTAVTFTLDVQSSAGVSLLSTPLLVGETALVIPDGSTGFKLVNPKSSAAGGSPSVDDFRLTLESGVPVSTTDQLAKTTLYLTPYIGDKIGVYNGSAWDILTSAEISITLASLTANKNYDVFVYSNSGTLTLELLAWTSDSARATALIRQDGILCKTGALTRRYVGTIRITGTTGQCESSVARRFVWNMYNRRAKNLIGKDSTDNWTYTTAAFRPANNNTTDGVGRVAFVLGLAEDVVDAKAMAIVQNSSAGVDFNIGIGLDSTTVMSGLAPQVRGLGAGYRSQPVAFYSDTPAAGYHYLQQLEMSAATGTTTWDGDGADATHEQAGLIAMVLA